MHLVDGVDDHDVHQVVRVQEEVERAREPPLRDVDHAYESSGYSDGILKSVKF